MSGFTLQSPGVEAVRIKEDHLAGILELMNREGWYYYDHQELQRYLELDQDCFVLLRNGRVIGGIFTTHYGNQAWIGNIVVAKVERGSGLAFDMIRGVIAVLQEKRRVTTFRLGSVPLAIGLYRKAGFHAEAFTTAQEVALPIDLDDAGPPQGSTVTVEALREEDLETATAIDQRFFKSDRLQLLRSVYRDSIRESCFCLKNRGRMAGFLMVRRRRASKQQGGFAEGPDYAYRLGPCCVLPEIGIEGFKALLQAALPTVNAEVRRLGGEARMYAVFPRNAKKEAIHEDTRALAAAMDMDADLDLDRTFDEHDHIFEAQPSIKNTAQWDYMQGLGFRQEYFEQVMSHTCDKETGAPPGAAPASETLANPEGIFATMTPGDKA